MTDKEIKTWQERVENLEDHPEWDEDSGSALLVERAIQDEINELRAALVERKPLSDDTIDTFYRGVAEIQPTLLTKKLFTAIVKAAEAAHRIKETE